MSLFVLLAVTHFIALLSPGPDFFLLVTTLLGQGYRAAHAVCLGIALANAVILLLILYALHQLGGLDPLLLQWIKYGAAVYLLYLALRCVMAFATESRLNMQHAIEQSQLTFVKHFYLGVQSGLLNPKNIIFYSSVFVLVHDQLSLVQQFALAGWMVSVVYLWNGLLLKLLRRENYLNWLQGKMTWVYGISAICFFSFALSAVYWG